MQEQIDKTYYKCYDANNAEKENEGGVLIYNIGSK